MVGRQREKREDSRALEWSRRDLNHRWDWVGRRFLGKYATCTKARHAPRGDRHTADRFFAVTRCRRVNDPSLPPPSLHARTVRVTIGIVQTATGEERGMEAITNGIDETGTPDGVLGGLLPHRRGPHEGRGIRGPSRPLRGEDDRVLARGQGEPMETRMGRRT